MSLVFLDFDNTILHGDAGPKFGAHVFHRRRHHAHARHGVGRGAARNSLMWLRITPFVLWMGLQTTLYRVGAVRRSTIVRNAYRGLRGFPLAVMEAEIDGFVTDHLRQNLYPEIVAEMEAHAQAGRRCIIVTTGMELLVSRVLPLLPKGTELIGCELEAKKGRLTGRVLRGPLYGADKANIATAYCRAAGVDPADCFAYTDHYSDHHMLDAVGHGIVVNPASRMARLANQRGWRVLRPKAPAGSGESPAQTSA